MGLVINTNIASLVAQQNLQVSNNQLKTNVQRLSSGFRVNNASDDAAGLARADQLRAQSVAVQAAMRNSNDGISALEIMDKSAEKVTELLVRMNDLSASSAQGTLDATTRGYYSDEFDALLEEINRIATVTEFGNMKLMNGTTATIDLQIGFRGTLDDRLTVNTADFFSDNQIRSSAYVLAGADITTVAAPGAVDFAFTYNGASYGGVGWAPDLSTVGSLAAQINAAVGATIASVDSTSLPGSERLVLTSGVNGTAGNIAITADTTDLAGSFAVTQASSNALGVAFGDINTQVGAQTALATIESALVTVNNARASFGADTNRLSTTISNLQVTFTNFQAAESRIRDADFAMETASFTRNQILVQSGVSVLAQANTLPQSALTLLQ